MARGIWGDVGNFHSDATGEFYVWPNVEGEIPGIRLSTDHVGRRSTPLIGGGKRRRHALVFGCSVAFGHGVSDDETLAAQIGRYAPDYRPYNYGVPGFGPNDILDRISMRDLRSEVSEGEGVGIYLFISDHVRRTPPTVSPGSIKRRPYYYEDGNGSLVRSPSFAAAFPWTTALFGPLMRSQTLKFFDFQLPTASTRERLRLAARLTRKMADEYHRQFPKGDFYVLLYPDFQSRAFTKALEAYGIKYLDYTAVDLARRTRKSIIASKYDSHPSAEVHRLVGRQLVRDLGLARD